jgi:hypothetical protein
MREEDNDNGEKAITEGERGRGRGRERVNGRIRETKRQAQL